MIDELLDKYMEKFGQAFPLLTNELMNHESLKREIENCIKSNKPRDPIQYEKGNVY